MGRGLRWLFGLVAICCVGACEPTPEPGLRTEGLVLSPVEFDDLPGWSGDRLIEALPALQKSCERLMTHPGDAVVGPGRLAGRTSDWHAACTETLSLQDAGESDVRALIETHFVPFLAANNSGQPGLFTGYYEAGLQGSRVRDETYRWPIYGRPDDLVTVKLRAFDAAEQGGVLVGRVESGALVPYYSRAEIDRGVLEGRDLEVLWVDDPTDAFFLHIQGSGQVRMASGETVRVGYAASNGHKFFAIGRALLDEGLVSPKDASMQGIRAWLSDNPEQAEKMMQRNKRYIFFHEIVGDGPIGAQGVPLTAGRSLAVDPAFIPYGAPIWLDTTWPDGSQRPLRRLVVSQDTGSAIKGPVRGDFYWGTGPDAAANAGGMKQRGRYYLFLPKAVAQRRGAGS